MKLTLRARLTLLNTLVLGAVMCGFGLALFYSLQSSLLRSVDEGLRERALASVGLRPGPPFGPMGNLPEGRGILQGPGAMGPGRLRQGLPSDAPGPAPNSEEATPSQPPQVEPRLVPPETGPMPPPFEFEGDRLRFIRRPRLLGLDGFTILDGVRMGPWSATAFSQSLQGQTVSRTISWQNEPVRVYSMPHVVDGRIVGVVQVARELSDIDQLWGGHLRAFLALLPLGLVVVGFGAWFLTSRALRPVGELARAAERIGQHELSERIPVTGDDELGNLANTFNRMLERLETAFSEQKSDFAKLEEQYELQRRFTADASHELRTPLTRIKVSASSALGGTEGESDLKRALEIVDRSADDMDRLIRRLLLLARSDAGQLIQGSQDVDLVDLCAEFQKPATEGEPAVQIDAPEGPLFVFGDPDLLSRAIGNLVENAVRHTPPSGHVTLRLASDSDEVRVTVEDDGEGIPPEALPHVFERFFRVDSARSRSEGGAGLGLAIVKSVAQAHGGSVAIDSELGKGTKVTLRLPQKR